MNNFIIKLVALALVLGLNMPGVLAVNEALAYFNDIENSDSSSFEVSTLDFTLRSGQGSFVPPGVINPGGSVTRDIYVTKQGILDFKYKARSEPIFGSCNQGFYDELKLEIWYNWYEAEPGPYPDHHLDHRIMTPKYNGPLKDFDDFDTNPDPDLRIYNSHPYFNNIFYSENEHWLYFKVTLPADFVIDPDDQLTCGLNFVFDGWQTEDCITDSSMGFSDTEKIQSIFTAKHSTVWHSKINKVYYDVDSSHGTEPANEWVEIYNDSDSPIDIMNWTIENRDGSDVISDSALIIPSYGFALITGSATTWDYWDVPDGVVKIILSDGAIGSGLDNDADMLVLRDNHNNIVDQMNWGAADANWQNWNSGVWDTGCDDVDEGHMLGRDSSGFDTNQALDFKDFGLPEIGDIKVYQLWGFFQPHWELVSSMLWGNEPAKIEWTAINPNNGNDELLIDIDFITDNDSSGTITSADQYYNIAQGLANPPDGQGSYVWPSVVPAYFGYVWFKITATGPENFMLNNSVLSRRYFEPVRGEHTMEEILAAMAAIEQVSVSELEQSVDLEEISVGAGAANAGGEDNNDIFSVLADIGAEIIDAVTGGGANADADADADASEQSEVELPTNDDENDSGDNEVLDTIIINDNTFVATGSVDTESVVDEIEDGDCAGENDQLSMINDKSGTGDAGDDAGNEADAEVPASVNDDPADGATDEVPTESEPIEDESLADEPVGLEDSKLSVINNQLDAEAPVEAGEPEPEPVIESVVEPEPVETPAPEPVEPTPGE